MKNIFGKFLVCGLSFAMLVSCDLNLLPTTSISYDENSPLFLSESDIVQFQNGVLNSYRAVQYGTYTQSSEVMCDGFNATTGFGNNYGGIHRTDASFTTSDSDTETMWANHYAAIKNYNIVINSADNVAEELKASASIAKGIALFCRASSYLTLARHFGNAYDPATAATDLCVPLVLKYDQLEKPARASVQAVYAQIIADLDEAETLLAAAAESGAKVNNVKLAGQVRAQVPTVDAVMALKARYYLDTKDYALAADAAESVIDSDAGYALANSAEAMVTEYTNDAGTEPVVQLFANTSEGAKGNTLFTSVGSDNVGKYFGSLYLPSQSLLNAYDAYDLRAEAWFTDSMYPLFINGTRHEGITIFTKYLDNPALHEGEVETGAHAAKTILISEMYLIAAEAYAQSGNSAAAKTVLNELQSARKANPTDGSLASVKKEWFRETVGEGHRLACLKRWGEGFSGRPAQTAAVAASIVMTGDYYEKRTIATGDYVLNWPVPSYEMKLNENLVQNPGYSEE